MMMKGQKRHRSNQEKDIIRIEQVYANMLNDSDTALRFMAETDADADKHSSLAFQRQLVDEVDRLLQQVLNFARALIFTD